MYWNLAKFYRSPTGNIIPGTQIAPSNANECAISGMQSGFKFLIHEFSSYLHTMRWRVLSIPVLLAIFGHKRIVLKSVLVNYSLRQQAATTCSPCFGDASLVGAELQHARKYSSGCRVPLVRSKLILGLPS